MRSLCACSLASVATAPNNAWSRDGSISQAPKGCAARTCHGGYDHSAGRAWRSPRARSGQSAVAAALAQLGHGYGARPGSAGAAHGPSPRSFAHRGRGCHAGAGAAPYGRRNTGARQRLYGAAIFQRHQGQSAHGQARAGQNGSSYFSPTPASQACKARTSRGARALS